MTLQKLTPGAAATVKIALVDEAGAVLTPTGVAFRVLDEADVVLQPWQSLDMATDLAEGKVKVTVPAEHLALTAPAVRGLRTIELQVATADAVVDLAESFLLQAATGLAFGINTFLTYNHAVLLSHDFAEAQTPGWQPSPRADREAALIEAYDRILLLPIVLEYDEDQSRLTDWTEVAMLRNLTPEQVGRLGTRMLGALRKAQLIEADEILNGDPVTLARRNGLLSMTVGESSQFFRSGKPLELPLSTRAMKYLERWVRFSARLVRQ